MCCGCWLVLPWISLYLPLPVAPAPPGPDCLTVLLLAPVLCRCVLWLLCLYSIISVTRETWKLNVSLRLHCVYTGCVYYTLHTLTPTGHPARNRQNNQPHRPTLRSHLTPWLGRLAGDIINCPFWQYWNLDKKKLEKQPVFVWKLFCDRRLIYLHFETDEWTEVATTGPHSILSYYKSPQTRWNIFLNQQCLIFLLGFVWTPSSPSSPI